MLYAKNTKGEESTLLKRGRGICPQCGSEVIAKCGSQKVWHWAHTALDCDHWTEPESLWHKNWKEIVPRENREITIGAHRADIRLNSGLVIELQNSSISASEIREREDFYDNMIWIFNGTKFTKNCILAECSKIRPEKPRYRSTGTTFDIFSQMDGYLRLINFASEQDRSVASAIDHYRETMSEKGISQSLISELGFAHKSYVPFVGKLETIKSYCFPEGLLARPVYFRWRWFSSSLASTRKTVFWDVGSEEVLICFPNGIAEVFAFAKSLYARRKLQRPSDLCAWVVPKTQTLDRLIESSATSSRRQDMV